MSLLRPIKIKLTIPVQKRIWSALEGGYASLENGRSHDFDELREYIVGDEVKDIDWKASARTGKPLIRTYVAQRRHRLLFVVNTGAEMQAAASAQDSKLDIAIQLVGALGYIAQRHDDMVALVSGDEKNTKYLPARGSLMHLEMVLKRIHDEVLDAGGRGGIATQLEYIRRSFGRRMLIVVVSDYQPISEETERLLKRLRVQHDIFWLTVGDIDNLEGLTQAVEVHSRRSIPSYLLEDRDLSQELAIQEAARLEQTHNTLRRLGIPHTCVTSTQEIVRKLIMLLEKRRSFGG